MTVHPIDISLNEERRPSFVCLTRMFISYLTVPMLFGIMRF